MAKSPDSSNSTPAGSSAVKRGLFTRKPKEAKAKKPSRLKQIGEVFTMTRRHDPMVPWLMLLVFLGVVAVSFLVGFWLDHGLDHRDPARPAGRYVHPVPPGRACCVRADRKPARRFGRCPGDAAPRLD